MTTAQHDAIVNAIPNLKKLYEEAGYKHALELEDKINSVLEDKYGTSACVFDCFPKWSHHIEAANCFQSGTWQIWNGDGEEDLLSIFGSNYGDEDDVNSFLYDYEVTNVQAIKKFIKAAEEWLNSI